MTGGDPPSLLPPLREIPFVCPLCRGALETGAEGYRCAPCGRAYPLHAGIPDFRVFPDPYLGFEEDRERTDRVLESLESLSFSQLLARYWSWSDETPRPLRDRFVETALRGEERARRLLDVATDVSRGEDAARGNVLEIGSGTGNLLAAADGIPGRIVGTDIAMRWLHLSRRRLRDRGMPEPALVCCCAEYLPFPDGLFREAFSMATLEFARDPRRFFAEAARVLGDRGRLLLNTVNRFSLAAEPHVFLRGVGYLPRRWQARYVRWRRNASFENIRLLSRREIDSLAAPHFAKRSFFLPRVSREALAQLPPSRRTEARLYAAASRLPIARRLLGWLGPEWDIVLEKY